MAHDQTDVGHNRIAQRSPITRQASPKTQRPHARRQFRRLRRRDPGYTTPTELDAALAPFNGPAAHTSFDLPATFTVREEFVGHLRHHRMAFTLPARGTLLKLLDLDNAAADEALEWLAAELRWPFLELHGHARGHTHPELIAALRALARCRAAGIAPRSKQPRRGEPWKAIEVSRATWYRKHYRRG